MLSLLARNFRGKELHVFNIYSYFHSAVTKVDRDHAFGDDKLMHHLSPYEGLSITVTEYSWFSICIQLCQGLYLFPCIDIYSLYTCGKNYVTLARVAVASILPYISSFFEVFGILFVLVFSEVHISSFGH